ncbi:MAG: hypothetical protein PHF33_04060 [Candidatus Delongbacteria bacterium]|jgi:hypothetical protein|nr:hypothetical protein [Candidatus Delongbacteria bacterium]MDD4205345.1 hypothetical protein [Candidatus Delongbacteria bacterium]
MKKITAISIIALLTAVLVATNPTKDSFEKYFASCFSKESGDLGQTIAANIFISRSLEKCEYKDMLFLSTVRINSDKGEFKYIGLFNRWIAL